MSRVINFLCYILFFSLTKEKKPVVGDVNPQATGVDVADESEVPMTTAVCRNEIETVKLENRNPVLRP